jgi:hypothetical protein
MDGSCTCELLLPRWPVSAVTSVTVIDVDGAETTLTFRDDYLWSEAGILVRRGARWPCHVRAVRAVYTAGYDQPEARVRRICLRLAAAGRRNPAGADSEDLGDSRIRWNTPGMALTTAEKDTLARYLVRG